MQSSHTHLSRHTRLVCKAALTGALLTLAGLTLVPSAQAQVRLDLGIQYNPTASGTATLTDTGTTASGTYTYNGYGTGIPLSQQTDYGYWTANGTSTANISGGSIYGLTTYNTSTANLSSGSISAIETSAASMANISGGSVTKILQTYGTSTVNISGGSVTNLDTNNTSTANISGGNVTNLFIHSISTANVSGGNISFLQTDIISTIDLFGTGFTETFLSAYKNPYNPDYGSYVQYDVTGTLQDGTLMNATYNDYAGTLLFNGAAAVPVNPVPEASSVVSFGLLLALGLGGLAVSARRRKAVVAGQRQTIS